MSKPTKTQLRDLIEKIRKWQSEEDKRTRAARAPAMRGGARSFAPPEELVTEVRGILEAFERGRFPTLERFVREPAQPQIQDVMRELGRVRQLID